VEIPGGAAKPGGVAKPGGADNPGGARKLLEGLDDKGRALDRIDSVDSGLDSGLGGSVDGGSGKVDPTSSDAVVADGAGELVDSGTDTTSLTFNALLSAAISARLASAIAGVEGREAVVLRSAEVFTWPTRVSVVDMEVVAAFLGKRVGAVRRVWRGVVVAVVRRTFELGLKLAFDPIEGVAGVEPF
jgi:hypothetical protein